MPLKYVEIDICGLLNKCESKKKIVFSLGRETNQLNALLKGLPDKKTCYKMLSVSGGFSSISLINYVAQFETITELYASTFRVGRKQFAILKKLHSEGKLDKVHIVTSTTQKNCDKDYKYYDKFVGNKDL